MTRGLVLLIALAAAGCTLPGAPTQSAFSRNVGFGSSFSGTPQSDLGSPNSGNTYMPNVPAAGGISANGGN